MFGVVLVTQPPFLFNTTHWGFLYSALLQVVHDKLYFTGVGLAGIGAVMGSLQRILISKCEGVTVPVLAAWSAVWGVLFSTCYCLLQPGSHILSPAITKISQEDWLLYVGLATSSLLSFTLMILALKLISPNLVSAFKTVELVVAFPVQSIVSNKAPDIFSCVGGGLIIAGVFAMTFQTRISNLGFSFWIFQNNHDYQLIEEQTENTRLFHEESKSVLECFPDGQSSHKQTKSVGTADCNDMGMGRKQNKERKTASPNKITISNFDMVLIDLLEFWKEGKVLRRRILPDAIGAVSNFLVGSSENTEELSETKPEHFVSSKYITLKQ